MNLRLKGEKPCLDENLVKFEKRDEEEEYLMVVNIEYFLEDHVIIPKISRK